MPVCARSPPVTGGYLGYAIGCFLLDAPGRPVLEFYHAMPAYEAPKTAFVRWGVWIIIAKGPIRVFIERRLMLVASLFAAALVGGSPALRYL